MTDTNVFVAITHHHCVATTAAVLPNNLVAVEATDIPMGASGNLQKRVVVGWLQATI
jgi:predicted RecA/RadA family phage recombinase